MDQPWRHNGSRRKTVAEAFWEKVDRSGGPGACWPWLGAKNNRGRGVLQVARRARYATHIAYELDHGHPLAEGMFACHLCDRPDCVNPAHLFAGDHKANMADMAAKGRANRAPKTAEQNAKNAESNRRHWADPEARARRTAARMGAGGR